MFHFLLSLACVNYNSDKPLSENEDTAWEIENFVPNGVDESCASTLGRRLDKEFTPHFQLWLQEHPEYGDLVRSDIDGGSFGGLLNNDDCLQQTPVVFVHGNSDRAIGGLYGGWEAVLPSYLQQDFRSAELYGTTYGEPTTTTADAYLHDQANLMQVRSMIEAVLEYTGSDSVHIVAHSLGVTLARRAILGGIELDTNGEVYEIGEALTDSVEVFVGIAGANLGLASCTFATTDVCNDTLGLYPGTWSNGQLSGQSDILQTINASTHYEGNWVYSIWGEADGLLGEDTALDCLLYGFNSCQIPGQDGEYNEYLNHFAIRDRSASQQIHMLLGTNDFSQ